MQTTPAFSANSWRPWAIFELIGPDEEQLLLVAFRLAADNGYDEFDVCEPIRNLEPQMASI